MKITSALSALILCAGLLWQCSSLSDKTWHQKSVENFRKSANYESDEESFKSADYNDPWILRLKNDAEASGHRLEFPPGLDYYEKQQLWHLSEGADIYPILWANNLISQSSRDVGTPFLEKLDRKFGLIADNYKSGFPIKWVGLTAAWSNTHPTQADIILNDDQTIDDIVGVRQVRYRGKTTNSIAMMGTNCALCHTAEIYNEKIKTPDHKFIIEGAPAMLNIRGFFNDLLGSTLKTMLTPSLMMDFLRGTHFDGNAEITSKDFAKRFAKDLGIKKGLLSFIFQRAEQFIGISHKINFNKITGGRLLDSLGNKKAIVIRELLYKKRDVVEKYLVELLKITYKMDEVPKELQLRMKYFALLIGADPKIKTTPEGYARTDAFGRISNLTARANRPVDLTAMVSLPQMYGIKYKALFHFSNNTNSVLARNIGQSFGLGAIFTDPEAKGEKVWNTTSNLHNLVTMEKFLYKLEIPQYTQIFGKEDIDHDKMLAGCETYHNSCVGCHGDKERVGPQNALILDKMIDLETVGTNDQYLKNKTGTVLGADGSEVPFADALSGFTKAVVDNYLNRYDISSSMAGVWANSEIRGNEFFRDTFLGETRSFGPGTEYAKVEAGKAYPAPHLAGVWSTAPYLHNGSVASMYELLKPSHKRQKIFFTGSNQYDTKYLGFKSSYKNVPNWNDHLGTFTTAKVSSRSKRICEVFPGYCLDTRMTGNSNKGHEPSMYLKDGKSEFSHGEKMELIEFLKVLRPPHEYSWRKDPMYTYSKQSGCQLYK